MHSDARERERKRVTPTLQNTRSQTVLREGREMKLCIIFRREIMSVHLCNYKAIQR